MAPFKIRELNSIDAQALLAFEARNRAWFESHIDARDPAFYSLRGVADHIEGCLADFTVGVWHPLVIEDASAKIVGRANLKNIDSSTRCAEVGYRIDQHYCGQGLATLVLRQLIYEAQVRWALTHLVAYIFTDNTGSRIVLERCGFVIEQPACNDDPKSECRLALHFQAC